MKKWQKIAAALFGAYLLFVLGAAAIGWGQNTGTPKATIAPPPAREEITPEQLYNLTNAERSKIGAPLLSFSTELNDSAKEKCDDMAANNYYDHVNPSTGVSGTSYIFKHLQTYGGYGSENLDDGNLNTAKEFMDSWMGSESHKAAIQDPKYTNVGFAVCHIPKEPKEYRTVVMHLAEVKPVPQPVAQPAQQRSFVHCSSYELYGTVQTNCY